MAQHALTIQPTSPLSPIIGNSSNRIIGIDLNLFYLKVALTLLLLHRKFILDIQKLKALKVNTDLTSLAN